MTALKSHRNMLVPISRLPVEILSRIFFEYGLAGNLLFNVKWTKLMFVSRHWYDIGIQNKMLWSFFEADPVFMKRKLKQLDLSGSHDLTVRIRATSFYSGVVRNLKPHRDQIHYLEISGPTNYVLPTMNALSRFALPMLRSITLNPSSDPDPWSPQLNPLSILPKSWAYVPNNIFQNTVILRSVTIKGLSAKWTLLHDLVELCLTREPDNSAPRLTLLEIASLLKQSPSLKTLKLWHYIYISEEPDPRQSVALPELEILDILDAVESCSSLLSTIVVPATAAVHILAPDLSSEKTARDLLVTLRTHYRSPSARAIPFLRIHVSFDSTIISAYTTTFAADHIPNHASAYMSLTFYPADEPSRLEILTAALQTLPQLANTVTHLEARMKTADDLSPASWKTILSFLPIIQTLLLSINTAMVISFSLLKELENAKFPWTRDSLPLPRLHCIDFSGADRISTIPQDKVSLCALYPLIHALSYYSDLGHRIPVLNIRQFWNENNAALKMWDFVSPEHLQTLSKIVRHLFVDGHLYTPV